MKIRSNCKKVSCFSTGFKKAAPMFLTGHLVKNKRSKSAKTREAVRHVSPIQK